MGRENHKKPAPAGEVDGCVYHMMRVSLMYSFISAYSRCSGEGVEMTQMDKHQGRDLLSDRLCEGGAVACLAEHLLQVVAVKCNIRQVDRV